MRELFALSLIGLTAILFLLIWLWTSKNPFKGVRIIKPYQALEKKHVESLETGKRLVFGLGNSLLSQGLAIGGLIGLPILRKLTQQALFGEHAPLVLSGEGSLAGLSQLVLYEVYRDAFVQELFQQDNSQLCGTTAIAYMAGCLPEVHQEVNGGLVLVGHLRPEMGLLADMASRADLYCLAASDSPAGQAVFYGSTSQAVIGENFFAAGASLKANPFHAVSLRVQDVLRVLIIIGLIVGSILKVWGAI